MRIICIFSQNTTRYAPAIGTWRHYVFGLSVYLAICSLTKFVWCDISLFIGEISVKLGTDMCHVSGQNCKGFQGQRSKAKVTTTPNTVKNPLLGHFVTIERLVMIGWIDLNVLLKVGQNGVKGQRLSWWWGEIGAKWQRHTIDGSNREFLFSIVWRSHVKLLLL